MPKTLQSSILTLKTKEWPTSQRGSGTETAQKVWREVSVRPPYGKHAIKVGLGQKFHMPQAKVHEFSFIFKNVVAPFLREWTQQSLISIVWGIEGQGNKAASLGTHPHAELRAGSAIPLLLLHPRYCRCCQMWCFNWPLRKHPSLGHFLTMP